MTKINKKGFALIEVIIVTVFVTIVFTLLYTNVIPIMGSYEAEERYDSIDSKYTAHLVANLLRYNRNYNSTETKISVNNVINTKLSSDLYIDITSPESALDVLDSCATATDDCKQINKGYIYGNSVSRAKYEDLIEQANIEKVYLTTFSIVELKNAVKTLPNMFYIDGEDERISQQTSSYIKSLPSFAEDESISEYRLIVVTRDIYENDTLNFGTIEFNF